MWQKTWRRLVSVQAARRLLGLASKASTDGSAHQYVTPPTEAGTQTATLPVVLEVLQEHYRSGGEELVEAALQRVVQLDQTDADTALLAALQVPAAGLSVGASPQLRVHRDKRHTPTSSAEQQPDTCHLIVQLMRSYPHACDIRARCCRCLANLCQLAHNKANKSSDHIEKNDAQGTSLVDDLLRQGALEQALGTLAMSERLTHAGRCWAAMAVCNLTCLGREGTARAMRADAEVALAEFVLSLLLHEAESSKKCGQEAAEGSASKTQTATHESKEDAVRYTDMALDAALGALTACLTSEAPENSRNISYNYEKVSYVAVDAVVRVVLRCSALLVRDGRDDGVYEGCMPALRHGSLHFCTAASDRQCAAIARLLPLLHKAWMALHYMSSHAANLPLLYNALYEAESTDKSNREMRSKHEKERVRDGAAGRGAAQGSLYVMTEAALFLTTELEGLHEDRYTLGEENTEVGQSDELAELGRLQAQTRYYILATMADLTATRKDIDTAQLLQAASASDTKSADAAQEEQQTSQAEHTGDATHADNATVSSVLPTQAARHVCAVLASGAVSNMALATAVRLCLTPHDTPLVTSTSTRKENEGSVLTPWPHESFALLTKALLTLTHLAARCTSDASEEDEEAVSVNTIAVTQAMLRQAHRGLRGLAERYDTALHHLYYSSSHEQDVIHDEGDVHKQRQQDNDDDAISPAHRLLFVQYTALVGQVYALLWGALRSERGARAVVELDLGCDVRALQQLMHATYEPAVERARQGSAGHHTKESKQTVQESKDEDEKSWVPNAAEESTRLVQSLGAQLLAAMTTLTRQAGQQERAGGAGVQGRGSTAVRSGG